MKLHLRIINNLIWNIRGNDFLFCNYHSCLILVNLLRNLACYMLVAVAKIKELEFLEDDDLAFYLVVT